MKSAMIAGILTTLILIGCSAGYDVLDKYDGPVDFNELRTYTWKPIEGIKWLDHAAFMHAVDQNLSKKGFRLSPADADFVAETFFSKSALRRPGVGPRIRPHEGELILNFATPDAMASLWHGSARVEYDSRFPLQQQNIDIEKAVSTMLESFPPPPSTSAH